METYRLNSKLVEKDNEYIIQTSNDVSLKMVQTDIVINGILSETIRMPHPEDIKAEDVLSLVKTTHEEKKSEIESLLNSVEDCLNSGSCESIYNLGQAFYYKNFTTEARRMFQSALSLNPEFHQAANALGQVELALGDVKQAIFYAQQAVKIRPEFADYRNNLGEAFLAGKKYREATLEFERAMNINLYYSDPYFNNGLTLIVNASEKQNKELFKDFVSRAKDYLTKATLIDPEYRTVTYEKGIIALENRDIKSAFTLLKQVREDKKEAQRHKSAPYYMKYITHPNWVTEKAVQERIDFLIAEIKKNPTYVDLSAELAKCYLIFAKFNWKKGIEQFQKTIELNSSLHKIDDNIKEAQDVLVYINQVVNKIE